MEVVQLVLFKKHSFIFSLITLIVPIFVPYPMIGYLATVIILFLALFNRKSALFLLFVYFPIRPFIIVMNDGLKFVGDLLIILLFGFVVLQNYRHKAYLQRKYLFVLGFILFCLIGALAAYFSGVSILTITFQLRAFLITFLLIFIVAEMEFSKNDLKQLLLLTVIFAVILSVQGIVEKVSLRTVFLPEMWQQLGLSSTNKIRIYGLIGNPNVFALFLSIAFVSALYLSTTIKKYKYLLLSSSVFIFGVFLLTYSRGTFIAFLVSVVFYMIVTKRWRQLLRVAAIALLSVPLVFYPTVLATEFVENNKQEKQKKNNEDFKKRYGQMFSEDTIKKSTEWGRIYVVEKGIQILKDHPWFGSGFGTFGDSATLTYGSPIYHTYELPEKLYSDNQYIQILVQTGLIGTCLFMLFLIGMVKRVHVQNGWNNWSIMFYTFLLLACVAGVFYNILEDKTFTLYFYFMLGFLLKNETTIGTGGKIKKIRSNGN